MFEPSRIMVALDVDELADAKKIVEGLAESGVTFKIGNQLGTYEGWQNAIEFVHHYGARIFCDTKFKDIPQTVNKSSRAITRHRPDFFNVMADTDPVALKEAVAGMESAVKEFSMSRPIILGVTVLTSIDNQTSVSIYGGSSEEKVLQFAAAAAQSGLDGVVCSANEAKMLKSNPLTESLLLVTPGIRPVWAASGDQSRVITPKQAIEAGADYLVIGRPITQPPPEIGSPKNALNKILEEING